MLLYIGEGITFDLQVIIGGLSGSAQVFPLPSADDCIFCCEYRSANDVAEVQVKRDAETIVIDGAGEAALRAAIEVQKHSLRPVHIIDDAYSFEFLLTGFANWEELFRAITDAGG